MRGISFQVDESGEKTAVILNLRQHRRIWEDIYDRLLIESRRNEPRETLAEVRKRLARRPAKSHA